MTMKRTSFRSHNFKKSLKSAANLIFAIKGFAECFEGVESFGGRGGAPVSAGFSLRLGKAVGDDNLPFRTVAGGARLDCGGSGLSLCF